MQLGLRHEMRDKVSRIDLRLVFQRLEFVTGISGQHHRIRSHHDSQRSIGETSCRISGISPISGK